MCGIIKNNKQMIVITGATCSGKTTLANYISANSGIDIMSVEYIIEQFYDNSSFNNLFEKQLIIDSAETKFKVDLLNKLRTGNSIIIEYSFLKEIWNEYFLYVSKYYDYKLIVINCNIDNLEDLSIRLRNKRLKNTLHKAHISSRYRGPLIYEIDTYINKDKYLNDTKNDIIDNKYNNIIGEINLSDVDAIYKLSGKNIKLSDLHAMINKCIAFKLYTNKQNYEYTLFKLSKDWAEKKTSKEINSLLLSDPNFLLKLFNEAKKEWLLLEESKH